MVTKSKARQKRGKVKVGKLKLNKETVKDLTNIEAKQIKGGRNAQQLSTKPCSAPCATT